MSGVLTLAIETSNPAIGASGERAGDSAGPGVALGRIDAGTGAVEQMATELLDPSRRTEEELAPAIARLCGRCGVKPAKLQRVAVSVGPGGYTALRIAIVTAKLLAEVAGGLCISIPSAHVAAWHVMRRMPERDGAETFGVALQSKANAAFVTFFRRDETARLALALDEGELLTGEEFGARARERGVVLLAGDEHLPPGFREGASGAGIKVVPPCLSAGAVLALAARYPATSPGELAPLYAREPEAVTKWRERRAGGGV